ncbi:hypothetical protein [Azohydromonas lata]|uniref:Transposase n=1 Tax=Azohydromonas lata TaxID=45677 RepID=A0ABU5IHA2_9BURK|nr:hypothetical protein [Azohydromonas lata]MDZ5457895.1 hypothetical protein [Azohydromonas lata]
MLEAARTIYAERPHAAASASPGPAAPAAIPPMLKLHPEPAKPGHAVALGDELRIELPRLSRIAYFEGTRAQIEGDGLVPPGVAWPKGREHATWKRGGAYFNLFRIKPAGFPGRASEWAACDSWRLAVRNFESHADAEVCRLRRELEAATYKASSTGRLAAARQAERAHRAAADAGFQAFMGAVLPPSIKREPARRGRPAKATSASVKGATA